MNQIATSRRFLRGRTLVSSARRFTATIALTAVVLGVSACSSAPATTATTTTTPASTPTSGATGSTIATTSPASSAASLAKVESSLSSGESTSYVATYGVTSTLSGTTGKTNFTIAHQGTNSLFAVAESKGSFEEFGLNKKDTVCAKQGATWMCLGGSLGTEVSASLNVFLNDFGTKAWLAELTAASGGKVSSRTIDGQSDTCISFNAKTGTGSYTICVTSQGVLAEGTGQSAQGTWTVKLTNFSTNVPSNEFTPPAKVTTP